MKKIFISFFTLFLPVVLSAQNISGIINAYTKISLINQNVLTVNSSVGFNIGDKVMVIKMKGATVNQTNTAAYGDTIALGETGKYVFSAIIALTPTTVTLSPFCDVFADDNFLQLVSIPVYPNPTVVGTLTCAPWNGATGGILIFQTPGILTLNANIDISSNGYMGGNNFGNVFSCNQSNYFSALLPSPNAGEKGEGVAEYIVGQECGKGKLANGGGGSYSGNTGAGGGANAGKGGDGGWEYNGCLTSGIFSIGGQAIMHKNTSMIMGGGGGGPQHDNGQTVYAGGSGGGICYIDANQIVGNNFTIKSNGGSVPTINDEGSSAGGAGGSIILNCLNYTGLLNIETRGGNGGSNNNTIFPSNCHGPGGGGGGGLIWFKTGITPVGVTSTTNSGLAGLVLNPSSACFNTNYNAQNGNDGEVKYNFIPSPPPVLAVIDLGADTVICAGTSLTLDAGPGYTSYLWDNSTVNQTRNVSNPGIFYVTVSDILGCTASDTIMITLDNSVQANFTYYNQFGCKEDTLVFNNSSLGSTQYFWYFGDGDTSSQMNPSHAYTTQGIYTVTLVAGNPPCYDTIKAIVNTSHPIDAVFASNTNLYCLGSPNPIIFTSTSMYNTIGHLFDFGDGDTTSMAPVTNHFYTNVGTYTVLLTVTDSLGCEDTLSTQINVFDSSYVHIIASDSNICEGEPITFTAIYPAHLDSLIWDFGDAQFISNENQVVHPYDEQGNYLVTLTGYFTKCAPPIKTDTITIQVLSYPTISLGNDTSICPGLTGAIFLSDVTNSGSVLYEWSTGETTNAISVSESGIYWVRAYNGECSTTDSIWVKRDCYINIPNAFSPDGDGMNDYFYPRELLSSGVSSFTMNIYNRWGENIFTTNKIDGRGWDGRYNGVVQPLGVYVYVMDVTFKNLMHKNFQGNVTLIR